MSRSLEPIVVHGTPAPAAASGARTSSSATAGVSTAAVFPSVTSIDLSSSSALAASAAQLAIGLPTFIPLHPPAPADHHPHKMSKLECVLQNATDSRTPEQNALVAKKVRVLTGVFAACALLLPMLAASLHSTQPSGADAAAASPSTARSQ